MMRDDPKALGKLTRWHTLASSQDSMKKGFSIPKSLLAALVVGFVAKSESLAQNARRQPTPGTPNTTSVIPAYRDPCAVTNRASAHSGEIEKYADRIAPLADPMNRGEAVAVRFPQIVYWLAMAKQDNVDITNVLTVALCSVITNAQLVDFTAMCLLNNLRTAEYHGCLDEEGLKRMRQGELPVIRREPYVGKPLIVDALVSPSISPELRGVIANYELTPMRDYEKPVFKMSKRTRQRIFADKFLEIGVLSDESYRKVMGGTNQFLMKCELVRAQHLF